MAWGKRIFLFVATNFLIIVTLSIVLNVLGIRPYLTQRGLDFESLLLFAIVWGFGGAFISLAISRIMAKWMMGVKVIDPQSTDASSRWLLDTVYRLSKQAGLRTMPEVGVFESPDPNAFATGPTKNRALVAVSSGLLQRMNRDQAEGVLAHEVTHVANGDMVTMTLVQGVVNVFVLVIARLVAYAIAMNVREESRFMVHILVTIVMEIVLSILGMIVVAYFSRIREYRADLGGAKLAGKDKMIGALQSLQRALQAPPPEGEEEHYSLSTLKISRRKEGGIRALFATHPPLERRIQRLQAL